MFITHYEPIAVRPFRFLKALGLPLPAFTKQAQNWLRSWENGQFVKANIDGLWEADRPMKAGTCLSSSNGVCKVHLYHGWAIIRTEANSGCCVVSVVVNRPLFTFLKLFSISL